MNRVLRRLDSAHSKLLDTVAPIEDPIFCRKPSDDEWSVAQIVQHLYLVESRVVEELEKLLAGPPQKISFLRKLIPPIIVSYRLVRVKAPRAMNPVDPPSKQEIIDNYNAARTKLKELCAVHGRQRLSQVVVKHPFLGDISGSAAISFVGYHEVRHFKQIQEVLNKLRSNRA